MKLRILVLFAAAIFMIHFGCAFAEGEEGDFVSDASFDDSGSDVGSSDAATINDLSGLEEYSSTNDYSDIPQDAEVAADVGFSTADGPDSALVDAVENSPELATADIEGRDIMTDIGDVSKMLGPNPINESILPEVEKPIGDIIKPDADIKKIEELKIECLSDKLFNEYKVANPDKTISLTDWKVQQLNSPEIEKKFADAGAITIFAGKGAGEVPVATLPAPTAKEIYAPLGQLDNDHLFKGTMNEISQQIPKYPQNNIVTVNSGTANIGDTFKKAEVVYKVERTENSIVQQPIGLDKYGILVQPGDSYTGDNNIAYQLNKTERGFATESIGVMINDKLTKFGQTFEKEGVKYMLKKDDTKIIFEPIGVDIGK